MKKHCLTLDLKNDTDLIQEYIAHHQSVWPEVLESIHGSGIVSMEIFNVSNRLVMIIEVKDSFSFQKKEELDLANPKVQEWELLMDTYQSRLPFSKNGEKWVLMDKIFDLKHSNK